MKLRVIAGLLALSWAVQAEEPPRFAIEQFLVEGNSVLPQARIDAALRPFTGQDRDFASVQQALEALEALYRQAGYGSLQVYLPEQTLNQGQVRLQVIEPQLGQIIISGAQFRDEANVLRTMPALQPGATPNTGALARDLRLANESPSRRLSVALQAGSQPHSLDARVQVRDERPWRLFASADNSGSPDTGRARLSLGGQYDNLFNRDQVLTAQFTTAPEAPERVKIFGLGYKLPLYGWGDSLSLFGGYSNVDSAALQGLFNISGRGTVAGLRYSHELAASGGYQHKLVLGLDWRRFESETKFLGYSQGQSHYIIQPLSLAYQLQQQSPGWAYDASLAYARNWPRSGDLALASGRPGDRSGSTPVVIDNDNYQLARLNANGYLNLPADYLLHASLAAQLTPDALPSGEFFGLGGAGSVRGYAERALADDEGLSASLELYSPNLAPRLGWDAHRLQLLGFVDWGHLSRNQRLAGERRSASLAGLGLGLRAGLGKRASLRVDLAQALRDGGEQRSGDWRAHVAAVISY